MNDVAETGLIAISLKDVSVCYRSRSSLLSYRRKESCVLRDVSLDVYHGDSLGIIGRNGAGKSTLMKLLGGLINPDRGTVDQAVGSVSLLSIQVGFVPHLTGRNNAILSGILLGMTRDQMAENIEQIKEFSGLGDYFDERVECYSAGMRSRLGFSTAVNVDPEVLLLDEILAVGDAEFRKKSRKMINQKIHSDKTIILVSHSPALIRECCNRVVWIEDGHVKMQGDVETVLTAYENI